MSQSQTDACRLQALIERSPVACAFVRDGVFETAGEPALHLFARSDDEPLAGVPVRQVLVSDAAHAALEQQIAAAFAEGRPIDDEVEFVRRDGSRFWGRLRASPVQWSDPAGPALWFVEDATEQRRERMQPHWQAIHDPVTELANRREFDRQVAAHLGSRRREPVSVLVVDIDDFSAVNELMGFDGGDQALLTLGALLVAKVRASDVVARLEADRFGIVLPGCDQHYAELLAEKLRAEIARQRLRWGLKRMRVTARIAVVQLGAALDSPSALLQSCIEALTEARAAGGDTVRVAQLARSGWAEAAGA